MRLDLNLALEGVRPAGWGRMAVWAAAVLLVGAATAANSLTYRSLARDIAPTEGRLRGLEEDFKHVQAQQAGGLPVGTREALAALPSRVEVYNRIIEAAAFSWTGLLMELEAALPPNVGLTSIQPNPASSSVTIVGKAKGLDDVMRFVQLLEERPTIRDVQLQRHQVQERGGPAGESVNDFSIQFTYAGNPPGGQSPRS